MKEYLNDLKGNTVLDIQHFPDFDKRKTFYVTFAYYKLLIV